jgi:hypothetical protein
MRGGVSINVNDGVGGAEKLPVDPIFTPLGVPALPVPPALTGD